VPPHEVHVWFRATESLDEAAIAAAASVLSNDELARYRRFHFARDARDYAAAHALLRTVLSRNGDRAPERWRFDTTADGKPFLIDQGAFRASFSVSHSHGMVACAVTEEAEVGVDVECINRDVNVAAIAGRFFAPTEAAQLARLDASQRLDRFFDLWTLKEALSKALGVGMAASMAALALTVGEAGEIRLDAPDSETQSWQFGLFTPGLHHRLAIAVCRTGSEPVQLIFRSMAHDA
jgi:4'-phosphopantetheinyl transferase